MALMGGYLKINGLMWMGFGFLLFSTGIADGWTGDGGMTVGGMGKRSTIHVADVVDDTLRTLRVISQWPFRLHYSAGSNLTHGIPSYIGWCLHGDEKVPGVCTLRFLFAPPNGPSENSIERMRFYQEEKKG